jgi:hypothetical protein
MFNDDMAGCGLYSAIHTYINDAEGCHTYRLEAGCYMDKECEYSVRGDIVTPAPTFEPTQMPTVEDTLAATPIPPVHSLFPFQSPRGPPLVGTSSATNEFTSQTLLFEVCHGDQLDLSGCGDEEKFGDGFLRLFDDNGNYSLSYTRACNNLTRIYNPRQLSYLL